MQLSSHGQSAIRNNNTTFPGGITVTNGITTDTLTVNTSETVTASTITNLTVSSTESVAYLTASNTTNLRDVNIGNNGTDMNLVGTWSGWNKYNDAFTYSSASAPFYTVTIAADYSLTRYKIGTKVKVTHSSTTKYFIVVSASYSNPTLTLILYGGTDYTLSNSSITVVWGASTRFPDDFPADLSKWTVTLTDTQFVQTTSTSVTNLLVFSIPQGLWNFRLQLYPYITLGPTGSLQKYGFSSTNNTFSNDAWTIQSTIVYVGSSSQGSSATISGVINPSTTTNYYVNAQVVTLTATLHIKGDYQTTTLVLNCGYF